MVMKCPCEECISFAICKSHFNEIVNSESFPQSKEFVVIAYFASIVYSIDRKCGSLYEFIFSLKGKMNKVNVKKANKIYGVNDEVSM